MRVTAQIDYAADPATVFAMLMDPAFHERTCLANGAIEHEVEVVEHGDGSATITTRRTLPTRDVPDAVRALVGTSLRITQVSEWEAPAGDGERSGTVQVDVDGARVRLTAAVRLRPGSAGSVQTIDGDLKASVPLIGGRIEKLAEPAIRAAIRAEQRTATAWLSSSP